MSSDDHHAEHVEDEEIDELQATLKITEADINKRKISSLHPAEPKAAERLFRVLKVERFNAPDSYQKDIDTAKQEHRESVKQLIIATRKAKLLKAERDAARHAAIAEQQAREATKENSPNKAPKEPEVAPKKPRKPRQSKKRKAEEDADEEQEPVEAAATADGEEAAPAKETKKDKVRRLFLKSHTLDEMKDIVSQKENASADSSIAVMLTVHQTGKPYAYDSYILHPLTQDELAEMDAKIAKGVKCTCKFDALYWRGIISKHKKAHVTCTPETVPLGTVVMGIDMENMVPLPRIIFWPQA